MLTLDSYGVQVENLFRRILKAAGIRQAEGDFTTESLLLDAQRINPARLAKANEHRYLNRSSAAEILDWVYGIDHLIDLSGCDQIYAAIDLTLNGSKVNAKELKAQRLRPMWQGLGVCQFFVVHIEGDVADLTKAGAAELIEKLWAGMEEALNGPEFRVHTIRLRIA